MSAYPAIGFLNSVSPARKQEVAAIASSRS